MPHNYGLAQWRWNAAEQAHEPPPGAGAVLDLRPEAEQAKASQSSGWGLFAWPDQVYDESGALVANMQAMPLDAVPLGYGDCRELQPTTQQRDELKTRLGLSAQPSGATLIDTISDCLGALADPSGQNGPKPLLPTREGLEIHLAYHSRVWSQAFNGAELFATTAKGRANRIRDVLRSDLETANKSGGPDLVAKVLGLWCDRWGVSYTQAAKWRNLIRGPLLAELLGKSGGKFAPKKPRTSYSDDFNRADAATLGASWTQYLAGSNTIEVVSNACSCKAPGVGASTSVFSSRYDSDVSSSDHWCTITASSSSSAVSTIRGGPAARFSSSAQTFYWGYCEANTTSNGLDVCKVVAGVETFLAGQTPSNTKNKPWVAKLACSGSTITTYESTTQRSQVTDTSITGNTRGGVVGQIMITSANFTFDNWSCDDGVSAGGASRLLLLGVG